jgi:hypothetical protein
MNKRILLFRILGTVHRELVCNRLRKWLEAYKEKEE